MGGTSTDVEAPATADGAMLRRNPLGRQFSHKPVLLPLPGHCSPEPLPRGCLSATL